MTDSFRHHRKPSQKLSTREGETYNRGEPLTSSRPHFHNPEARSILSSRISSHNNFQQKQRVMSTGRHPISSQSRSRLQQQQHNYQKTSSFSLTSRIIGTPRSISHSSEIPRKITTRLIILVCGLSGAGKTLLIHKLKQKIIEKKYKNPRSRGTIGAVEKIADSNDIPRSKYIIQKYEIIFREIGYYQETSMIREECLKAHLEYPVCGIIYIIPSDEPHVAGNLEYDLKQMGNTKKINKSKQSADIIITAAVDMNMAEDYTTKVLELNKRKATARNYFFHLLSIPSLAKIPVLVLVNRTNPETSDQISLSAKHVRELLNINSCSVLSRTSNGLVKRKRKIRIIETEIIKDDGLSNLMEWTLLETITYYENHMQQQQHHHLF